MSKEIFGTRVTNYDTALKWENTLERFFIKMKILFNKEFSYDPYIINSFTK